MNLLRPGITASRIGSEEHDELYRLQEARLVRLSSVHGEWLYWTPTFKGARQIRAGLGEEFRRKVEDLLSDFDAEKAKKLGQWIEDNFRTNSPRTPKGGKNLKEKASKLVWVLKHRAQQTPGSPSEVAAKVGGEIASDWKEIEPQLASFVAKFTEEGTGRVIPKELLIDGVTYINEIGVVESEVEKYAKRLGAIFKSMHGWRNKALKGGLKVVLASPRNFRGTTGGKYKRNEDALYVRATPKVLNRDSGYASFEYIIVHELGHRYEKYNRQETDFDKPVWWTSRYSSTEGEAFAELFAIGHFKLTGSWDNTKVERFENLMSGKGHETEVSKLPPHLQRLVQPVWQH